jgi:hypothetical protein
MFSYRICDEINNNFTVNKTYLKAFQKLKESPSINLSELDTPFIQSSYVWVQIYNKNFLNANNIRYSEDLRIGEDAIFYFKSILYSNTISILNKPLYNYRINNNSTTNARYDLWEYHLYSRKCCYDLYKEQASDILLKNFIVYYIKNVIYWYNRWKNNPSIHKKYYQAMRRVYIMLENSHDIKQIKKYIKYKDFKRIIKYNYFFFSLLEIIKILSQQIFSLKNVKKDGIKNKYIILLGIKIRISTTPLVEN